MSEFSYLFSLRLVARRGARRPRNERNGVWLLATSLTPRAHYHYDIITKNSHFSFLFNLSVHRHIGSRKNFVMAATFALFLCVTHHIKNRILFYTSCYDIHLFRSRVFLLAFFILLIHTTFANLPSALQTCRTVDVRLRIYDI